MHIVEVGTLETRQTPQTSWDTGGTPDTADTPDSGDMLDTGGTLDVHLHISGAVVAICT